ncbi:MAG TPA: crosslink repair DNA glycosylase YcaQ family protein, partial [Acidimicrobiia bacterium]
VQDLAIRYLRAFGPASVSDMRIWSGLTGLKEVFTDIRPRLRVWKNEDGGELFDLEDSEHPDADTPAPPRLLPEYDNLLLGHADRSRFFDGAFPPGWVGSVLVDGRYAGWWRQRGKGDGTGVDVELAVRVSRQDMTALQAEAGSLCVWLGGDAGNVRFVSG